METFAFVPDFTISKGSEWKTEVSDMETSVKQYRQLWPTRKSSWSLSFKKRSIEESMQILAFFDRHRGRAYPFNWECIFDKEIYKVRFMSDRFKFDYNDGLVCDFSIDIEQDNT